MKHKKLLCLLVTYVLCVSLFTVCASAKISTPTNTLTTNGNGGKTDVGIWFVTYNNKYMWGNNFGSGYPINYRTLMPDGSYGILDSSKVEYIDFQLKQIANAKIDFLIYDITNGGLTDKLGMGWSGLNDKGLPQNEIVQNAILTCQRIAEWNKNNDWKLKYCLAVGAYDQIRNGIPVGMATEYQAEGVYKYFYEKDFGGDNYYQVDGKPMLIILDWANNVIEDWDSFVGDRTYGDKFFVRGAKEGEVGMYGWHTEVGSVPTEEVVVVAPGHDTAGAGEADVPRANGEYYKKSWETVLTSKLSRFVIVTSFNDYNEQTAVWIADSSKCREGVEEKWTDKTGKINNSMYWDMTKEGIRLVRTYNGEIEGKFESLIFDLGNNTKDISNKNNTNTIIIIILATAGIVVIGGVVVVLILTSKKHRKGKK